MTKAIGKWTLALTGEALPGRALVGGKAWSIARMQYLGLPVPPAFTITTEACHAYLQAGQLSNELLDELGKGLEWLAETSGRNFNADKSPLLVSVRSGAPISMPGMMDTILNLGITDATERALAEETGNAEFARDTHRRFLELFPAIAYKATVPELDPHATPSVWREEISSVIGKPLSIDPQVQLTEAVEAVFSSWNSRRAKRYRKHNGIPDDLGTAVTVQAMVFGNLDDASGTGVVFSRNPLTGESKPYGEYLHRAQGEDVVSGKFTPQPLEAMRDSVPLAHEKLLSAISILEDENGDVQDIEFTVQRGELFLLQTRAAKRAPEAAVRFAIDMVNENRIDIETSLARVSAEQVRSVLAPKLKQGSEHQEVIARGEPACQGIGIGVVVSSSDEAEKRAAAGESVVLARPTTSPEDVHGMIAAKAVVTEQGGSTSHAAVVSRALGTPCVVGCGDGALANLAGQLVTVDGQNGKVLLGAAPIEFPLEAEQPELAQLIQWLDERITLEVELLATAQLDNAFDLSSVEGGEDVNLLSSLIVGKKTVMGGAIESDAGVAAALDAGVTTIIATNRLPVMLAAWHHMQSAKQSGE
jgi:pyruvate, orthophosphate dikinase